MDAVRIDIQSLEIQPTGPKDEIWELLLLADPSQEQIDSYVHRSWCYAIKNEAEFLGVIAINPKETEIAEIENVAVKEAFQNQGIGKLLLQFAIEKTRSKGFKYLQIATGNSSIAQLVLYQKLGFEIVSVVKNHFVHKYPEPIVENGIVCKHKLILEMAL